MKTQYQSWNGIYNSSEKTWTHKETLGIGSKVSLLEAKSCEK